MLRVLQDLIWAGIAFLLRLLGLLPSRQAPGPDPHSETADAGLTRECDASSSTPTSDAQQSMAGQGSPPLTTAETNEISTSAREGTSSGAAQNMAPQEAIRYARFDDSTPQSPSEPSEATQHPAPTALHGGRPELLVTKGGQSEAADPEIGEQVEPTRPADEDCAAEPHAAIEVQAITRPQTPVHGHQSFLSETLRSDAESAASIAPERRGGRPHGPSSAINTHRDVIRRPQLVCIQQGLDFTIGFSVDSFDGDITANGISLPRENGVCRLTDLSVPYRWSANTGEELLQLSSLLTFELSANGDRGRQRARLTPGRNLVVAPAQAAIVNGSRHVVSEPGIGISAYRAWEIEVNDGDCLYLVVEGSEMELRCGRVQLYRPQPMCSAVGGEPVYGARAPEYGAQAMDESVVSCIVLGTEGAQGAPWRRRVDPSDNFRSAIPALITERGPGRYFIRLYEAGDLLADSESFWYVPALKEVYVTDHYLLHQPMLPIQFSLRHAVELKVLGLDGRDTLEGRHQPLDWRTPATGVVSAVIPEDVPIDFLEIHVEQQPRSAVTLAAPINLVWWQIAEGPSADVEWSHRTAHLSPDSVRATANTVARIRLPASRPDEAVLIEVDGWGTRKPDRRRGQVAEFELRNLEAAARALRGTSMRILVRIGEVVTPIGIVIPSFSCRRCSHFSAETLAELQTHYASEHVNSLVPLITDYREIIDAYNAQANVKQLPTIIQKCYFCNHYVAADDKRLQPETEAHRKVCRSAEGRLAFEVVTDIRQITNTYLQYVLDRVGTVCRCALCGKWFFNVKERPLTHVWREHGQGTLW